MPTNCKYCTLYKHYCQMNDRHRIFAHFFSEYVSAAIPKNLTFCFPGNFSVKKLYEST